MRARQPKTSLRSLHLPSGRPRPEDPLQAPWASHVVGFAGWITSTLSKRHTPSQSSPSSHVLPASFILQLQVTVLSMPTGPQSPWHASHSARAFARAGFASVKVARASTARTSPAARAAGLA